MHAAATVPTFAARPSPGSSEAHADAVARGADGFSQALAALMAALGGVTLDANGAPVASDGAGKAAAPGNTAGVGGGADFAHVAGEQKLIGPPIAQGADGQAAATGQADPKAGATTLPVTTSTMAPTINPTIIADAKIQANAFFAIQPASPAGAQAAGPSGESAPQSPVDVFFSLASLAGSGAPPGGAVKPNIAPAVAAGLDPSLLRFIASIEPAKTPVSASPLTSAAAAVNAQPATPNTAAPGTPGAGAGLAAPAASTASQLSANFSPIVQGQAAPQVAPTAPPLAAGSPAGGKAKSAGPELRVAGAVDAHSQVKPATLAAAAAPKGAPVQGDGANQDPGADAGGGSANQSQPGASAGGQAPAVFAATGQAGLAGPIHASVATPAAAAAFAAANGAQITAQLAAQISQRADARSGRFDFALDPQGLGHVDVKLRIAADGQLSAALAFDNPAAAAEAKGRAGDLQQALQQAGFDVSQSGLSFSSHDHGRGPGHHDAAGQSAPAPLNLVADIPATASAAVTSARSRNGGLDIVI